LVATEPGDFVYLDPPYVPLSSTSSFTAYTASGWSADDHRRLAKTFVALAARGVQVLLSNSDTPLVRRLYAGWRQVPVVAPRSLGASTGSAGSVGELLISSGFPRLRPSYS
jgi:DNA adenine methylase